ncbi:phospholipase A2 activator protein isoform X2 [Rhodnius prolixus]|uniref:phospholipase A2 activator protein isoform X2 n=1 Tax=Rhodnius prolixus TaxID=13249 RepID=UPI003D187C39
MSYNLTKSIKEHSSDVRAVCLLNNNQFLTTSRDTTSIVWDFEGFNPRPVRILVGHTNYVCTCCFIPPSPEHPEGLIVTGGNDNVICVYDPSIIEPLFTLTGHTKTVCTLTELSQNLFASGAWDSKIMIWDVGKRKCTSVIHRHEGSVFALILLSSGKMLLSASADKTINVYAWPELDVVRILTGHDDCVRDLAELSADEFLSCSNDGTIRKWNAKTGAMLAILFTSDDFLYSIDSTKDGSIIVSGGENNTLVVMDGNSGQVQIMKLPSLTVCDGYIRIYTHDTTRHLCSQELGEYEVEVSDNDKEDEKSLHLAQLPGPEALIKPGVRDAQILLIREHGKAVCYQWSEEFFNWVFIGDVTGSDGSNNATASQIPKLTYEGKEYDYVFDVDLGDGGPILKLPFSEGNDPVEAALDFLRKHNLPLGYLGNVIDFIRKSTSSNHAPVNTSDLFSSEKKKQDISKQLFPTEQYVVFSFADVNKIKGKLVEFACLINGSKDCDEVSLEIDKIINMAMSAQDPADDILDLLGKCLEWPQAYIYPVLDLIRIAMTHEASNSRICQYLKTQFINTITTYIQPSNSLTNNMLTLKILSNMIVFKNGQEFMLQHIESILKVVKILPSRVEKTASFELAVSSFILNVIILLTQKDYEMHLKEALGVALASLSYIKQKDAPLRLLIAIRAACNRVDKVYMTPSTKNYMETLARSTENDELSLKIKNTALKILEDIQSKLIVSKGSKAN